MKFLIFILFLVSSFFIAGCNPHSGPMQVCIDKVQFDILNSWDLDDTLCYDEEGIIRLVLLNRGSYDIESWLIEIVGEDSFFKKDLGVRVTQGNVIPVDIAFNIKSTGPLDDIKITPRIKYENKTLLCNNNYRHVVALTSCSNNGQ